MNYSILDFGAVGDGATLNTASIQLTPAPPPAGGG